MVTTTDTIERAVSRITTTELMLGDLPEIAAEWNALDDGERAAWSIDWNNEMAGLAQVARLAAGGALSADPYSRYRRLLAALADASPILNQLNLSSPELFRNP